MEQPTNQGDPTREELAEVLDLRERYGKEGIRMFLRKQKKKRAEREAAVQREE